MNKLVGSLVVGAFGFWAVLFLPARYFGGVTAVVYNLVALALCLAPAVLTLSWASRHPAQTPQETVLIVFGGTGLRMVFVLGGGLLLYSLVPYFQQLGFWLWLLAYYLFMLTLEVVLLRGKAAPGSR